MAASTLRTYDFATKLFVLALCLAAGGGAAFYFGLGIAFTPGQSGGDFLAMLGILFMGIGAVLNLLTTFWGGLTLLMDNKFYRWWPLSLIATCGTAYGVVIAANL